MRTKDLQNLIPSQLQGRNLKESIQILILNHHQQHEMIEILKSHINDLRNDKQPTKGPELRIIHKI